MTEFNTVAYTNDEGKRKYKIIFETDNHDSYLAVQDFCRNMIDVSNYKLITHKINSVGNIYAFSLEDFVKSLEKASENREIGPEPVIKEYLAKHGFEVEEQ